MQVWNQILQRRKDKKRTSNFINLLTKQVTHGLLIQDTKHPSFTYSIKSEGHILWERV